MVGMALERPVEELDTGLRLAVFGKQLRLRDQSVEQLVRMLARVVIEQREGRGPILARQQQVGGTRARGQPERGVLEPAITCQRGFGVTVARSDVGQIEERSLASFAARDQI